MVWYFPLDAYGVGGSCFKFSSGLDIGSWYGLETLVSNGSFPSARLDDMATRIVGAWYATAQDTNPGSTVSAARNTNVQGNHSAIIREAGAAGIVILKNTGALPFIKPTGIAIIGQDARPPTNGPNALTGTFLSTNVSYSKLFEWEMVLIAGLFCSSPAMGILQVQALECPLSHGSSVPLRRFKPKLN